MDLARPAVTPKLGIIRSGRWRSQYIIDLQKGEVTGDVMINVHYYEQGNVSDSLLSITQNPNLPGPGTTTNRAFTSA